MKNMVISLKLKAVIWTKLKKNFKLTRAEEFLMTMKKKLAIYMFISKKNMIRVYLPMSVGEILNYLSETRNVGKKN
jgi:hypothetical protein